MTKNKGPEAMLSPQKSSYMSVFRAEVSPQKALLDQSVIRAQVPNILKITNYGCGDSRP